MNNWNATYLKGYALGSIFYVVFLLLWALIFISQGTVWAHILLLLALCSITLAAYSAIQNSRAKNS